MATLINFQSIADEAKKRQAELRYLPYLQLMDTVNRLQINLKDVKGIDVIQNFYRKAGLIRPYKIGMTVAQQTAIGKIQERELRTKMIYSALVDNIHNYDTAPIMNNPFDQGSTNQSKKNPMEVVILGEAAKSFGEDIAQNIFFGERDDNGTTSADSFDGINTLIDDEVSATVPTISVALKNQVNTGAIVKPTSGYAALTQILDFVSSVHPMLRMYPSLLYLTPTTYRYILLAYENKMQYKNVDLNAIQEYINDVCNSKITIVRDELMGTGDRIMLTAPGIFDLGVDTMGDFTFIQPRQIDVDPNIVQYWMQGAVGMRINSVDPKVFCINDGTPVGVSLAGDYQES